MRQVTRVQRAPVILEGWGGGTDGKRCRKVKDYSYIKKEQQDFCSVVCLFVFLQTNQNGSTHLFLNSESGSTDASVCCLHSSLSPPPILPPALLTLPPLLLGDRRGASQGRSNDDGLSTPPASEDNLHFLCFVPAHCLKPSNGHESDFETTLGNCKLDDASIGLVQKIKTSVTAP